MTTRLLILVVAALASSPTTAQVEITPWEGTAQAIPLEAELGGNAVIRYTLIGAPTRGVVLRNGAGQSVGASFSPGQLLEYPWVYRHTAVGSLAPDSFRLQADLDGGAPPVQIVVDITPAVSPVDGVEGLVLWLDAGFVESVEGSDAAEASDGDPVAAWRDRSGLVHDATQGVPVLRPRVSVAADARGHLQGVRFAGDAAHLISAAHVATDAGPAEATYIAAFKPLASDNRIQGLLTANGSRSGLFVSGTNVLGRGYSPQNSNGWSSQPIESGEWSVATARFTNDFALGHELFVNGALRHVTGSLPELLDIPETRVGDSRSSRDTSLDGTVGELILLTRAVGREAREAITRYLTSKWGRAEIHDRTQAGADLSIVARGNTPVILLGGLGHDSLNGADGDDVLVGGPGNDLLLGGGGLDRFVFENESGGNDSILDFRREDGDEIDLAGVFGDGADGGLERYVRIESAGSDSMIDIDAQGGAVFDPPDMTLTVVGVGDLSAADLITGIETAADGLESLSIVLDSEARALEMGTRRRVGLLGNEPGGGTREIVGRRVVITAEPRLAEVDHRGWILPHAPGRMTLMAEFDGAVATLGNVTVQPTRSRPFRELDRIDPGGDDSGAYQGVAFGNGHVYASANFAIEGDSISKVLRLSTGFEPLDEALVTPPGYGGTHIGALDFHEGSLYATFMEVEPLSDPQAGRRVGLARIDPDSLQLEEYYELSDSYDSLDAICFHDGDVWLPTLGRRLTRMPMTPAGPDTTRIRSYSYQAGIGAMQGIRIHGERVYTVPENTTSLPAAMGIAVFSLGSLVEDPDFDPAIPRIEHLREFNLPQYVYPIRYPAGQPYHESFDFDPDLPGVAYMPFIPGGDTLVKMDLQLCDVDNPDGDGDGFCLSSDCDDANAAVHPDRLEACDNVDNDCNALPDDTSCAAFDTSGNGLVDGTDLAWLGRAFGDCSVNATTRWWAWVDYTRDGCVDGDDLAALAAAWGCRGAENFCP